MSSTEDLAARAAAAATAGAHEISHIETPHPSLEEVSDAMVGLPDEERAGAVLEHAEDCDECAAHVAELESVIELARFAYPDPMPARIESRLEAVLATEAASRTGGAAAAVDARSTGADLVLPTSPSEPATQSD